MQIAEEVLRRHRLTERFLVDMLGMPWHEVHDEATRLEHYISGAVAERVSQTLLAPTTCPHGNPIPGYVPDARNYLKEKGAVRLLLTEAGKPLAHPVDLRGRRGRGRADLLSARARVDPRNRGRARAEAHQRIAG